MLFTSLTLLLIEALIGFNAGLIVALIGVSTALIGCEVEVAIGCTGGKVLNVLRTKRVECLVADDENIVKSDKLAAICCYIVPFEILETSSAE